MCEQESLQRLALEECNVSFINKLDVTSILPYLIARHLLTEDDKQVLMLPTRTQVEKTQYLLDVMPRKATGWFEQFIECLRESTDGTGHGDLVTELEAKVQELKDRNVTKGRSKKKVFKLSSKASSAGDSQQPVNVGGGLISDVSNVISLSAHFSLFLVCLVVSGQGLIYI